MHILSHRLLKGTGRVTRAGLIAVAMIGLASCRARPQLAITQERIDTPRGAYARGLLDGSRYKRSKAPLIAFATAVPAASIIAHNDKRIYSGPVAGFLVALPFSAWTGRSTRLPPPGPPENSRAQLGLTDSTLWRRYQLGFSDRAALVRERDYRAARTVPVSAATISFLFWLRARLRAWSRDLGEYSPPAPPPE